MNSLTPRRRSSRVDRGTGDDAENPRARLAAELLDRAAHSSTASHVKAFINQGGGQHPTP
jgi:hypothetical protein